METLVIKIKIKMLLFSAMLKLYILVKLSFTVPNKINTKINCHALFECYRITALLNKYDRLLTRMFCDVFLNKTTTY